MSSGEVTDQPPAGRVSFPRCASHMVLRCSCSLGFLVLFCSFNKLSTLQNWRCHIKTWNCDLSGSRLAVLGHSPIRQDMSSSVCRSLHPSLLCPPTYTRPLTLTPCLALWSYASPTRNALWSRDQRLDTNLETFLDGKKPTGKESLLQSLQAEH